MIIFFQLKFYLFYNHLRVVLTMVQHWSILMSVFLDFSSSRWIFIAIEVGQTKSGRTDLWNRLL